MLWTRGRVKQDPCSLNLHEPGRVSNCSSGFLPAQCPSCLSRQFLFFQCSLPPSRYARNPSPVSQPDQSCLRQGYLFPSEPRKIRGKKNTEENKSAHFFLQSILCSSESFCLECPSCHIHCWTSLCLSYLHFFGGLSLPEFQTPGPLFRA